MNTGIQDAWNLGWKLALVARGLAADDLLESYEVERWPVGRDVLRFTDRLFTIATTGRLAALRTRVAPRVAPLVMRLPLRSYGFRIVGQLAVSYRGSPAVSDEGGRRPGWRPRRCLRAGDRLPDIRVAVAGTAGAVRLHDVVGAPGYHVLRLDDGPAPDVSPYGSTVFEHRIHGWRAGRSVVVVRPDGHVGHAGTAPGAAAYLRRWLRPEA